MSANKKRRSFLVLTKEKGLVIFDDETKIFIQMITSFIIYLRIACFMTY